MLQGFTLEWLDKPSALAALAADLPALLRTIGDYMGPNEEQLHQEFLEELKQRVIFQVQLSDIRWIHRTRVVEKKGGKWRKIVNCRPLNAYIRPIHFKMEGIEEVQALAKKGCYATSLDIKSAFHHIVVRGSAMEGDPHPVEGDWQYLCFRHRGNYYAYRAMPFGPAHSPLIFKRVMEAPMRYIRDHWGIQIVIYADDLLLLHEDPDLLRQRTLDIALYLSSLGFLLAVKKCEIEPVQNIAYLGWQWNLVDATMRLRTETRKSLLSRLRVWRRKCVFGMKVPVPFLAEIVGRLIALKPQHHRIGLYLGPWYSALAQAVRRTSWNGWLQAHPGLLRNFAFLERLVRENTPWEYSKRTPAAVMTTDASATGCGATLQIRRRRLYFQTVFEDSSLTSSNQRESMAVLKALQHFKQVLIKENVRALTLQCDNSTTVQCLAKGRARGGQHRIIRAIYSWITKHDIWVHPIHLPGVQNEEADALSRLEIAGDYEVAWQPVLRILQEWEVRPTIDLFATAWNRKLPRYVAPTADPHAEWIDAFARPWMGELPLCHPPPALIGRCLTALDDQRTRAVVILPKWPGQWWWPTFRRIRTTATILGLTAEVLIPGPSMTDTKLPPGELLLSIVN
jgi:ribonuclease HI